MTIDFVQFSPTKYVAGKESCKKTLYLSTTEFCTLFYVETNRPPTIKTCGIVARAALRPPAFAKDVDPFISSQEQTKSGIIENAYFILYPFNTAQSLKLREIPSRNLSWEVGRRSQIQSFKQNRGSVAVCVSWPLSKQQ